MKSFIYLLILLLFVSFSSQACIPGENCPYNQGECSDNQCLCKDGYFTLIDPSIDKIDQVFCDYEQMSMKLMLLLEVLLPSSGQFLAKRWIHGGIKAFIVVLYIIMSCLVKKQFLIPKCIIIAKNALIGGGGGDKDDDKKDDKLKGSGEGNNKKDEKVEGSILSDCMSLRDVKDLEFGGTKQCITFLFYFSTGVVYVFWIFYSIDIYLIFFQIYSDGEGIPFGD